jgi:hypothetical protein
VITVLMLGGVVILLGEKEKVNPVLSPLTFSERTSERDAEHCIASTSRLCSHMYHFVSEAIGLAGSDCYRSSRAWQDR